MKYPDHILDMFEKHCINTTIVSEEMIEKACKEFDKNSLTGADLWMELGEQTLERNHYRIFGKE